MSAGECLTLRPQRVLLPWVFGVALTVLVTGLGIALAGVTPAGWWLAGLAAPVALLTGLELHPDCSKLVLTEEGITVCRWFRAKYFAWNRINFIGVGGAGLNKVVVLDFKPGFEPAAWRRGLAQVGTGHHAHLPNTYGMSADALAVLLKRWQDRCFADQR